MSLARVGMSSPLVVMALVFAAACSGCSASMSSGPALPGITGGGITEYRTPTEDSFPAGIAPGRGGSLWFTELTAGNIGRISRSGHITEFAAPGGGYPGPITRALDGSLWFVGNAKRDAVLGRTQSASRVVHFAPPEGTQ